MIAQYEPHIICQSFEWIIEINVTNKFSTNAIIVQKLYTNMDRTGIETGHK